MSEDQIKILGSVLYFLCAATSMGCMLLLINRYRKARATLLFWSAAGFLGFTITNVLLFIDLAVVRSVDLSFWRNCFTLAGAMVMIYGLISEGSG